jgi:LysM repeat protein
VRLTRRGRLAVTLALLVMASAVGLLSVQAAAVVGVAGGITSTIPVTSTVTVAPGDTLWAIAERVDPHSDPRAVVEALRELNGLATAQLRAGQELVVPTG